MLDGVGRALLSAIIVRRLVFVIEVPIALAASIALTIGVSPGRLVFLGVDLRVSHVGLPVLVVASGRRLRFGIFDRFTNFEIVGRAVVERRAGILFRQQVFLLLDRFVRLLVSAVERRQIRQPVFDIALHAAGISCPNSPGSAASRLCHVMIGFANASVTL